MSKKKPEATVVTTLTVTHVLRGCTADEATKIAEVIAEVIAENARGALATAYAEYVLPQGQPDDISVSSVQIFGFDGEKEEAAQ